MVESCWCLRCSLLGSCYCSPQIPEESHIGRILHMKVTIFFWVSSDWNDADEAWKSLSMNPEALQGLISAFLNYWKKTSVKCFCIWVALKYVISSPLVQIPWPVSNIWAEKVNEQLSTLPQQLSHMCPCSRHLHKSSRLHLLQWRSWVASSRELWLYWAAPIGISKNASLYWSGKANCAQSNICL